MTLRLARFSALLALLLAVALVPGPAGATSLFGREAWLAWPRTPDVTSEDPAYDLGAELVVIAADRAVSVRVTAPGVDRVVSASPGAPASVLLSRASVMIAGPGIAARKAIHLERADPSCGLFGAVLRVPGAGASVADDALRALPADLLGERTFAVGYWGESELVVVATQDGTQVTITDRSCPEPASVTLNRGDAWLHECVRAAGDGSVSGALVTASAPVAVISGSAASSVVNHEGERPGSRAYWGWDDVLLESPWPADMLGREHAHAPFRRDVAGASGDLIRVTAGCADTSVRVTEAEGTRSWTLGAAGDHADVESPDLFTRTWRLVPGAARVWANRGVLAAAFTVGGLNAGVGDPSLTVLDPIERWEREAVAWLPAGYENSLSIVTDAAATPSVRVDGAPVAGWAAVPGTTLSWARLDRTGAGERRVTGSAPLSVQVAGYTPGAAGAFSYPALPLLRDATGAIGGLRVRGLDPCSTSCPGTCVTLRAPPGFASYSWSTGAAGQQVTECPLATTVVGLAATDAAGCRYEGSATLAVVDAPNAPAIEGPDSTCAGACIELAAPVGYDTYAWSGGESTRTITACPSIDTVYTVTVAGAGGCGGDATHGVTVHGPPVAGDALVTHPDPCLRGLEVTWLEAAWRAGSPGGVYNVYRRDGGCAAVDDPSWTLLAVGLTGPPWRDLGTVQGRTYAYLVEAEDAPEEGACNPGPAHGGSTGRRCARPPSGLADPGDPDEARLVSFSPHLRALGYERPALGAPATAVTFAWPTLPPLDPATHVEAWRGTDARSLVRVDPAVTTPTWRDGTAADAWLLFYRIFNATACGELGQ